MQSSSVPCLDLASLFAICCRLRKEATTYDEASTIEAIIMHPEARERRESACDKAMGPWAGDTNRRDDVIQDAMCSILESVREGSLFIKGDTPDDVGKWIWSVWYYRCCTAWGILHGAELPVVSEHMLDVLSAKALLRSDRDARQRLMESLEQLDELGKLVMAFRMENLTIRETADELGISKSEISRLLRHAIQQLREAGSTDDE